MPTQKKTFVPCMVMRGQVDVSYCVVHIAFKGFIVSLTERVENYMKKAVYWFYFTLLRYGNFAKFHHKICGFFI